MLVKFINWICLFSIVLEIISGFTIHSNRTKRQSSQTCPSVLFNSNLFKCKSGECIDESDECDGKVDCKDASDESNACHRLKCPSFLFKCKYGACIEQDKQCDGKRDCRDGSDENNCAGNISASDTSTSNKIGTKCSEDEFQCNSGQCIDEDNKCDGVPQCGDSSDESLATCENIRCPGFTYKCAYGACVNGNSQCNGIRECFDGSDEDPTTCNTITPPTTPPTKPTKAPPTPSPIAPPGKCTLPEYPDHGRWSIIGFSPQNTPGAAVPNNTFLFVSCNKNFKLDGEQYINCQNGFWSSGIGNCLAVCPNIFSTKTMKVTCRYKNKDTENCTSVLSGTTAYFTCAEFYEDFTLVRDNSRYCHDGTWDQSQPNCQPVCGKKSTTATTLIVDGKPAKRGDYPWQVAIYRNTKKKADNTFKTKHICGGSLINQRVIITAAHCVTDIKGNLLPKENFAVAVGKYYRNYDDDRDKDDAQFSKLKLIVKSENYRGENLKFLGDIAVLVTEVTFTLTVRVQPVCFDRALNNEIQFSDSNVLGFVTGWGHTVETGTPSDVLKELKVPYIEYDKCKSDLPVDYEDFLTPDKICAGFLNKSMNVCSGDSGGGLVFKNRVDGRYYLTGIVSLSPRAPTTEGGCNSQTYALYTKVAKYINELILEQERIYRPL